MISAGNDIVSLAAIDVTRTNQNKFYSKILSDSEIPLYNEFSLAQIPFENFVWLLWSIKESAYKFLQRDNPALVFTPVRFVASDLQIIFSTHLATFSNATFEGTGFETVPHISGVVSFADQTLYSCSLLLDSFIHSVVNQANDFENVCWGIKKIGTDDNVIQSAEVRSLVLNRLMSLYGEHKFAISKNFHGVPVLLCDEIETEIPVSLSHHGCFVGYSLVLPVSLQK